MTLNRSLLAASLGAALALPLRAQTTAADSAMVRRADHARIEGSAAAPVWLIEISDFQCPYCRLWHEKTYPLVMKEYVEAGKVRLAYINFPLAMHKNAMPAAEAAMCAAAQEKFWPMQDALFNAQDAWEKLANPAPVFDSLAKAAGVNVPAMRKCIAGGVMKNLIAGDIDRAKTQGVGSTPSFMIPGLPGLIAGAQPIENFREALDSALGRAATAPKH